MSLPFTEQQCFFVAIVAFIIIGFTRSYRRVNMGFNAAQLSYGSLFLNNKMLR
jgi:hypothetical protein